MREKRRFREEREGGREGKVCYRTFAMCSTYDKAGTDHHPFL